MKSNFTLPVGEIMAIIKQKKPHVFSILRSEYSNNLIMNIVTHIDLEYQEAYKRISKIKTDLGIIKRY